MLHALVLWTNCTFQINWKESPVLSRSSHTVGLPTWSYFDPLMMQFDRKSLHWMLCFYLVSMSYDQITVMIYWLSWTRYFQGTFLLSNKSDVLNFQCRQSWYISIANIHMLNFAGSIQQHHLWDHRRWQCCHLLPGGPQERSGVPQGRHQWGRHQGLSGK